MAMECYHNAVLKNKTKQTAHYTSTCKQMHLTYASFIVTYKALH